MSTNPADVLAYSEKKWPTVGELAQERHERKALAAFAQDVLALHVEKSNNNPERFCSCGTQEAICRVRNLATKHGIEVTE